MVKFSKWTGDIREFESAAQPAAQEHAGQQQMNKILVVLDIQMNRGTIDKRHSIPVLWC